MTPEQQLRCDLARYIRTPEATSHVRGELAAELLVDLGYRVIPWSVADFVKRHDPDARKSPKALADLIVDRLDDLVIPEPAD